MTVQPLTLIVPTDQHKISGDAPPPLDMESIVLGVYQYLCSPDRVEGLQILTVISREYPELVNRLLLDRLLNKVIFSVEIT